MIDLLLKFKRVRKDKNGESIIGLSDKVINGFDGVSTIAADVVLENEIARPDKLSLKWYGSSQYAWVILKYNGIANPLSLNEGFRYKVPALEEFISKLGLLSTAEAIAAPKSSNDALKAKAFEVDGAKVLFNAKQKRVVAKSSADNGVKVEGNKIIYKDNSKVIQYKPNGAPKEAPIQVEPESTGGDSCPNCDNNDSEVCKLCNCNPKLSDVLIYKLLNSKQV